MRTSIKKCFILQNKSEGGFDTRKARFACVDWLVRRLMYGVSMAPTSGSALAPSRCFSVRVFLNNGGMSRHWCYQMLDASLSSRLQWNSDVRNARISKGSWSFALRISGPILMVLLQLPQQCLCTWTSHCINRTCYCRTDTTWEAVCQGPVSQENKTAYVLQALLGANLSKHGC